MAWRSFIISMYAVSFTSMAAAQSSNSAIIFGPNMSLIGLSSSRQAAVVVSDQVTDGCWLSPQATVDAVKLELIRNDFKIVNQSSFSYDVHLIALGYQLSDSSCAVAAEIEVTGIQFEDYRDQDFHLGTIFYPVIYSSNILLTGNKTDMTNRVTNAFEDLTRGFLVKLAEEKSYLESTLGDHSDMTEAQKRFWINYFDSR